jgi:hypothetical protein
MESQRLRTKMFTEERVVAKVPGAAPGSWLVKSKSTPVDEAVNYWLEETGHTPVACTAPGFHFQWLDKDNTIQGITIGVILTYLEGPNERTTIVSNFATAAAPQPTPTRDSREPDPAEPAPSTPFDAAPAGPPSREPGGYAPFPG